MRRIGVTHIVIALAVWLSLVPLGALLAGHRILSASLPLLIASAVVGAGLALLKLPQIVVFLAQGVAAVGLLVERGLSLASVAHSPLTGLRELTSAGLESVRTGTSPLEVTEAVVWLCLLLTAVLLLMVELLGSLLEQPAWSIAPLALVFGIAALILPHEVPWGYALPVIVGYVLVLLTGTPSGRDAAGGLGRRVWFQASRSTVGILAAVVAAALALGTAAVVPVASSRQWQDAGSDGPIQLADPTLTLNEDLHRPSDSHVLTYTTDTGEPTYLRTVALSEITSEGASLVPMNLSRFGLGMSQSQPGTELSISVEMAVPSDYLPVPFAPRSIDAAGDWTHDPATLSIVASGPERAQQTVALSYRATSRVPSASREQIAAAEAGSGVDPITQEVPPGITTEVENLLDAIVVSADTAGERALAIQDFLLSDRFEYSLAAPSDGPIGVISNFLTKTRSGYCVHFATSMAILARMAGIPARIAVGFAPGEEISPGTFEVTAHDAHAWPELFLDGLGWVPFEPTPAFGSASGSQAEEPTPSAEATPQDTEEPSAEPTEPTAEPVAPEPGDETTDGDAGWLGSVLIAALVALLLASPALLRIAQRRSRLARAADPAEAVEAAWEEVQATFADYALPWPPGSPVPAAEQAAADLPDEAADALRRLALGVEQSRFARSTTRESAPPVRDLVPRVRRALSQQASPGRRVAARLIPASALPWRRR